MIKAQNANIKYQNREGRMGFTLIEVVVYFAILGVFLFFVVNVATTVIFLRAKSKAIESVSQNSGFILHTISLAIRRATGVSFPAVGASGSTLVLVMPVASRNPTTFSVSGGILYVQERTGPLVALMTPDVRVSGLVFRNLLVAPGQPAAVKTEIALEAASLSTHNAFSWREDFFTTTVIRR